MSRPSRIRTLLVEDQGMFRALMQRWLADHPRFNLVGAAVSAEAAMELMATEEPDILLVDLQLPGKDGLDFVRAARKVRPGVRALTRVRESGVEGYVEKDSPPEVVEKAVMEIVEGGRYFSARFLEIMGRENAGPSALGKLLSRRQQEIMAQVIAGKTSREIADFYGIGQRTVEFHRANLMAKLGVANTVELVALARSRSLG